MACTTDLIYCQAVVRPGSVAAQHVTWQLGSTLRMLGDDLNLRALTDTPQVLYFWFHDLQ